MDLVYLVQRDLINNNNELRYSLRSAEKHLNFDRVVIIGYKPQFLNDKVIFKEIHDTQGHKYENVAEKIKMLIECDEISDDFIFMNDDFFLLTDYPVIPYYYNRNIRAWIDKNPFNKGRYYKHIGKLAKVFPEGKFFEVHCPIVYNKRLVKDVIDKYKLELTLMLRSYYCNEYESQLSPIEETTDYKIYKPLQLYTFRKSPFISCTNVVASDSMFKSFIATRFPKKSGYEN